MTSIFGGANQYSKDPRGYWDWFSRRAIPRKSQLSRAVIERLGLETLIIVTGVSGAGKSTFLDLLEAGALSDPLMAALPRGCRDWLQTDGNKVIGQRARDLSSMRLTRVEGAVQHYDILAPFDTAVENYETDPALKLMKRAEQIVVVNIRPGPQVLREHLAQRLALRRVPPWVARLMSKGMATRMGVWLDRFPDPHRLTGNMLAPRRVRDRQRWNKRYALLRDLYELEDWLDGWYRQWDSCISASAGPRLQRIITVAPVEDASSPSFRLLQSPIPITNRLSVNSSGAASAPARSAGYVDQMESCLGPSAEF